jgi:hypothetical protein
MTDRHELTEEETQRGLEHALQAREARAAVKASIHSGNMAVGDALRQGARGADADEIGGVRVVGRMEVAELLMAVREVGPLRAAKILAPLGLDGTEHVDVLSGEDLDAIVAHFERS